MNINQVNHMATRLAYNYAQPTAYTQYDFGIVLAQTLQTAPLVKQAIKESLALEGKGQHINLSI